MEGIQGKANNEPHYRWKAFKAKPIMSLKLEGIQGKANNEMCGSCGLVRGDNVMLLSPETKLITTNEA